MKFKYKFNNETIEIEVTEEWGNILLDLDRQERKPVGRPITEKPMNGANGKAKSFRGTTDYKNAMLTALRTNFRKISNVLSEGVDANGGYLVPEEYDRRLIDVLWL